MVMQEGGDEDEAAKPFDLEEAKEYALGDWERDCSRYSVNAHIVQVATT